MKNIILFLLLLLPLASSAQINTIADTPGIKGNYIPDRREIYRAMMQSDSIQAVKFSDSLKKFRARLDSVKINPAILFYSATLSQTAVVAIAAGRRTLSLSVPGLVVGDKIDVAATAPPPAGYNIITGLVNIANVLEVLLDAPLLAINATYNIPIRITVFR